MSAALNILIIDERPDGMVFLSEFLHTRGHNVAVSNDGQEALEAILRRHRTHDAYGLIFASLTMVRLDGLSVLRHLQRRQLTIPSVLYAAAGAITLDLSNQAKQMGCRALLEKPISLQAVERILEELIGRHDTGSAQRRVGTESRRRDDGKPFFGSSRVMRTPDAPESNQNQYEEPSRAALERIRSPHTIPAAPEIPVYEPEILPTPDAPMPAQRGTAPTRQMQPPTGRVARPLSTPQPTGLPQVPGSIPSAPPIAPPSKAYYRTKSPTIGPDANRSGGTTGDNNQSSRVPSSRYARRPSGLFTNPNTNPPSTTPSTPNPLTSTTTRFRRSLSGVQEPTVAPAAPVPGSRPVACAYCRQVFLVVEKPQSYTVVCVHCGQLNRIDPR